MLCVRSNSPWGMALFQQVRANRGHKLQSVQLYKFAPLDTDCRLTLFFCVHADYWVFCGKIFLLEAFNVLKLFVALLTAPGRNSNDALCASEIYAFQAIGQQP